MHISNALDYEQGQLKGAKAFVIETALETDSKEETIVHVTVNRQHSKYVKGT